MSETMPALKCGDSHTVRVTFTDATTGDPVDLTGCRVSWTLRTAATLDASSDESATIAKVSTDLGVSGVASWDLTPTETRVRPGVYVWDVQLVDSAGRVRSSDRGRIEFVQDVTKDTA